MIFRVLWGIVICWVSLVLFGIAYYGWRWFVEVANPVRHELLIAATISATWVAPALLLALVLTFGVSSREHKVQRFGWVTIGLVPLAWGLLVAAAAVAA